VAGRAAAEAAAPVRAQEALGRSRARV